MNWHIFWLAAFWWFAETKYFGWNATPGSDFELICDFLVLVLLVLAIIFKPKKDGE